MFEFSRRAGMSKGYVHGLIKGPRKGAKPITPTTATMQKLCDALGVSRAYILDGADVSARQERIAELLPKLLEQDQDKVIDLMESLARSNPERP